MIIIEPVLRILGFVCSYYMKCCRSPDCEAQSVNMSAVVRLFGRTLPRVLNRTCSVKINSNINARNFFHSSRLFNKPFYTVTYDLESGEKHTVQVRELRIRKKNPQKMPRNYNVILFRPRRGTTSLISPSTMTSTLTGSGRVRAPWPAPRVTSSSQRRTLPRLTTRRRTRSLTCWTSPSG